MNRSKKIFLIIANLFVIGNTVYSRVNSLAQVKSPLKSQDAPSRLLHCPPGYKWATVLYLPHGKELSFLDFQKNSKTFRTPKSMLKQINTALTSNQKVDLIYDPSKRVATWTLAAVPGKSIKIPYSGTETIYVTAVYSDGSYFRSSFDTSPNDIGCICIDPTQAYMVVDIDKDGSSAAVKTFTVGTGVATPLKVITSTAGSESDFAVGTGAAKSHSLTIPQALNNAFKTLLPVMAIVESATAGVSIPNKLRFFNTSDNTPFIRIHTDPNTDPISWIEYDGHKVNLELGSLIPVLYKEQPIVA